MTLERAVPGSLSGHARRGYVAGMYSELCAFAALCAGCGSITAAQPDAAGPADAAGSRDSGVSPAAALSGQRWLSPCIVPGDSNLCSAGNSQQSVTIGGASTDTFQVSVRIRGVAEVAPFMNGITTGSTGWYVGGVVGDTYHNTFKLTVSSPAAIYYANYAETSGVSVVGLDYNTRFAIDGGATATFEVDAQDATQRQNVGSTGVAITLPGVTTTPSPYDGQFLQLDVIDVQ